MPKEKATDKTDASPRKRGYISQKDVPHFSLEQALRIPRAILNEYAGDPTSPLRVAKAVDIQPNSSNFRMLCGSANAYGLTAGGANAAEIKVEPLAKRILRPLSEGDDRLARREALLMPRVFGEFLRKYDGSSLPRADIARNVLADMGVPEDKASEVFELIKEESANAGILQDIKGTAYVDLSGIPPVPRSAEPGENKDGAAAQHADTSLETSGRLSKVRDTEDDALARRKRVYVTHGKDTSFVDPVKRLLTYGELEPVVSVERQSVSQPVPDKVMSEMRSCGAAVIHVDAEQTLLDQKGKEYPVLNPNVLIEIGAAMALYGRRFILLVREGVSLPSNLQGLYEVRYSADTLNGDVTIKLLQAIDDMKKHPLPHESDSETD